MSIFNITYACTNSRYLTNPKERAYRKRYFYNSLKIMEKKSKDTATPEVKINYSKIIDTSIDT